MIHKIKTPPSAEPVTLVEMRSHIGITQSAETSRDTIISNRIVAARMATENMTKRAWINQSIEYSAAEFSPVIPLIGPLQSVTSVRYLDLDGVLQTLDPSIYDVDTAENVIYPAHGQFWPSTLTHKRAVRIEYVAGYGADGTAVPVPVREAIAFIVSQWEVFQTTVEGAIRPMTMPNAAKELLSAYVDYRELIRVS